ncbi:MAG: hypothetical protein ACOH5I_14880 [Oligoflexus sp.]
MKKILLWLISLCAANLLYTACYNQEAKPKKITRGSNISPNQEDTSSSQTEEGSNSGSVNPNDDALLTLHKDLSSCVSCHEINRPAPPHVASQDCVNCHSYPGFDNIQAFSHLPKPETCEDCHARPTTTASRAYPNQGPPVDFDPNNPNSIGSGHYVGKDCVTCHNTPAEGSTVFSFTHSTPRTDFCLPCHFNDAEEEHAGDGDAMLQNLGNCFSCHMNFDRNAERNFDVN